MRRTVLRLAGLMLMTTMLAGCDKCADYFLANPFATKPPPPHSCHEEPAAK